MKEIIESVALLVVFGAVGYFVRQREIITDKGVKELSGFLIKIAMPALILYSLVRPGMANLEKTGLPLIGISIMVYALSIVFGLIVARLWIGREPAAEVGSEGDEPNGSGDGGMVAFGCSFSNVGYMGIPVAMALFGEYAVGLVALYNLPFALLVFTLGQRLIAGKAAVSNWKQWLNPCVIASIIGLGIYLAEIQVPDFVLSGMKPFADMTLPLSMLVIGAMLHGAKLTDMLDTRAIGISLIRLIVIPAMVYGLLIGWIAEPMLIMVPVIIAAMPIAANAPVIAEHYNGNVKLATRSVFLSTVLSVISIPAWGWFVLRLA